MRKSWSVRGCGLGLSALLVACSGGKTVDLGGDEQGLEGDGGAVCDASGVATGDFYVGTYDALRKLEGCHEIRGSLIIGKLDIPDLTPLSELRVVDGTLHLGEFAYEYVMGTTPSDLVFVPGEGELSDHEVTVGPGEVWFPSLAGLGSLEGVHDLVLEGIGSLDLAELGNLRRVGGSLTIGGAPALRDLSGLRASSIGALGLSSVPELVSLDGLPAVKFLDHLGISDAPKLVDIAALAGVSDVRGDVLVSRTGLQDVHALSDLVWTGGGITIEHNPELADLAGLDGLGAVSWIELNDNAKLSAVPRFSKLTAVESLQIRHNPALEEIDLRMPKLEIMTGSERNYPYQRPWRVLEVDHNAGLQRLTISQNARIMEAIAVHQNDSLEQLDLGGLQSADELLIDDNPVLSTVVAVQVQTVDALFVTNNPRLSLAPFADVQTFVLDTSGNADELAP